jgi:DDE superfamily endonuclease
MNDSLTTLQAFRQALYGCFERRADALMDLTDALLTAGPVLSPAHLSLEAVHRRGWGSLYAALAEGRVNSTALRAVLVQHPLADGEAIYAVDCSVWARCAAQTSPQRGYYHHSSRHTGGVPVVPGWAYQWVSQLSFRRDSWTAPVDVQRVPFAADVNTLAAEQIKALLPGLPPTEREPLFVFDAGYDPVQLTLDLEGVPVAILVRLRKDRCFYADPDPATMASTGRPPQHGHKFDCTCPATWLPPAAELRTEDPQYGTVRVRAWAKLHPKQQNHPARGTRKTRPVVRGTLILVEVSRLPGPPRPWQLLWLWWVGPGTPDLALLWRAYIRRFDEEHTFRFLKQILNWTTPRVRHPEQADRWTWLVLAAYTQLRLACPLVQDQCLPWERPRRERLLSPYRVRRAFSALLLVVGTPAKAPKPCGRSPGRPKGRRSDPAPRHPVLKKTA